MHDYVIQNTIFKNVFAPPNIMSQDLLLHTPCTGTAQKWHQFGTKYDAQGSKS